MSTTITGRPHPDIPIIRKMPSTYNMQLSIRRSFIALPLLLLVVFHCHIPVPLFSCRISPQNFITSDAKSHAWNINLENFVTNVISFSDIRHYPFPLPSIIL